MDYSFYKLKVLAVRRETPDAVSIRFEKHPAFESYKAGQFITVRIWQEGKEFRRAYSLCSSPLEQDGLMISVKKIPGGKMSPYLVDQVKEGDELELMPPIGNFVYQPHLSSRRWFVLFGAGSGITPLFSILKTILLAEPQSFVSLLYGSRKEEDIFYKEEFQQLLSRYPSRLKVMHTLSQPDANWFGEMGRISENLIGQVIEDLKPVTPFAETRVYTCGPSAMMDEVQQVCLSQGVSPDKIFRESFSADLDEATRKAIEEQGESDESKVEILLDGERYNLVVPRGKTILDAALDEGIDMPYSCQSGLCTACRALCKEGKVAMEERDGLSDEEIEEGYVLTCVGHAQSARLILEVG